MGLRCPVRNANTCVFVLGLLRSRSAVKGGFQPHVFAFWAPSTYSLKVIIFMFNFECVRKFYKVVSLCHHNYIVIM